MSTIRMLHLSDVHWSPETDRDIRIVVDALIRDLNRFKEQKKTPDIVVFSGDLVWSGADPKHFQKAFEIALLPILKLFAIPIERFFICAGNHDIDRSKVSPIIETGLVSSLKTSSAVNHFVDSLNSGDSVAKIAMERLKNFDSFAKKYIKKPPNVLTTPLFQSNRLTIEGMCVGVSIFNTAWRCTGAANDSDRNLLLLGERCVDDALLPLDGCDIKIAIFHHPTDWLSDADQAVVLNRLYSEFDVLMHGHIHKSLPEQRFNTSGTAILSQVGCLYNSRDYPNSYQMISIDTDSLETIFDIRTFFDAPRREFDAALNVNAGGVFRCDLFDRNKSLRNIEVRRQLKAVSLLIRAKEAEHLDIGGLFQSTSVDARNTFVCPPLAARKFELDIQEEEPEKRQYEDKEVSLDELLRSDQNLIFSSQKEAGKTSLGNHIAVLTSEGLSDKDRIPFVVSYANIRKGKHGLIAAFYSYYGASAKKMDFDTLLKSGNLLIIVDDVKIKDETEEDFLTALCSDYAGCRLICLLDSNRLVGDPSRNKLAKYFRHVFIKPLPRRSIRELSKKWGQLTGVDELEANKFIVRQVQENNLPRTGYIISLLIWAYQKQKKLERINEAFLINAIIDSLLNKGDFTQALRKEFDPVSAEITLQEIAVLFKAFDGSCPCNTLAEHLIQFFRKKALDFDAVEVITKLIDCGILTRDEFEIRFKYKCFQEYFIALFLMNNNEARHRAINDEIKDYRRELYLLSGLRRKNSELLNDLRALLEKTTPTQLSSISQDDFAAMAAQNIFDPHTRMKLTAIKTKKVTTEQVDDLLDATERQLDKRGLKEDESQEHVDDSSESTEDSEIANTTRSVLDFMANISLYGLVTKNSEFDDGDLKIDALRYYLDIVGKFIVFVARLTRDVVNESFDEIFVKPLGPSAKRLSEEEKNAIKAKAHLSMQKMLVSILTSKISDEIATEKLKVTYSDMMVHEALPKEAKLIVGLVNYDLNVKGWEHQLKKMIDLNSSPFMVDAVTDRLWYDLYTRYEPEDRRSKIAEVVDHLATKVGKQNERSANRQAIDRAAMLTEVRGKI